MSPKQITRLGIIIGGISIVGILPTLLLSGSALGLLVWWPAWGVMIALLLFVAAYLRGAYLMAQRRVEMVDMLNDCYNGVEGQTEASIKQ